MEVPDGGRDTADFELIHPSVIVTREAKGVAFFPKCIKEKKYTLAAILTIAALVITIIALEARKRQSCLPCILPPVDAACPDRWIGYQGKCYFVSEDEQNWTISELRCSGFGSSLAIIDTQEELDFWKDFTHPTHYWIGLSREAGQQWLWSNGTAFQNQFTVRGEGFCAYLDALGVSSTRCSLDKRFLCNQADACTRRRKQDAA